MLRTARLLTTHENRASLPCWAPLIVLKAFVVVVGPMARLADLTGASVELGKRIFYLGTKGNDISPLSGSTWVADLLALVTELALGKVLVGVEPKVLGRFFPQQ